MSVKHPQRGFLLPLLLGAGTLAVGSCGYDDVPTPTEGTLRVAALTQGSGLDANGYTVAVNNSQPDQIGIVDTIYLDDLEPGVYQVALGGLQENCETLTGTNPQTTTVLPGDTVGVTFNVTCESPPPGGGGGDPIP